MLNCNQPGIRFKRVYNCPRIAAEAAEAAKSEAAEVAKAKAKAQL